MLNREPLGNSTNDNLAKSSQKTVSMKRALSGITVLDFTSILAGPYCTKLLADMGAEVIKVEPPGGEHSRFRPPFLGRVSVHFAHLNCGKKSLVLDLKTKPGVEAAILLAQKADVVVENWRPGVAQRLGLDYRTLGAANSQLIYCSISGYGQDGPSAKSPAYASIVEAASGYSHSQMQINRSPTPPISGTFIGDSVSGLWAFSAIQAALVYRNRTNLGQFLDLSMLESMLNLLINETHEAQLGPFARRYHLPLRTLDGYVVVPPVSGANWVAFSNLAGRSDWIDDPRFSGVNQRNENWFEMLELVESWTSIRTTKDCEAQLKAVGVPMSPFRTVDEALADPQLIHRGALSALRTGAGTYMVPNVPFLASEMDTRSVDYVPELNADGPALLRQLLGYSTSQIEACCPEPPVKQSEEIH